MARKPTGGKPGRPESLERQRKIAAVVLMKADGKKKSEIAAALGINGGEVDAFWSEGKKKYIEAPTREGIAEVQAELWGLLEAIRPDAYSGSHLHQQRAFEALDRIIQLGGMAYADKTKNQPRDNGSEIDRWLLSVVQGGANFDEELTGSIIEHYEDDDDLAPKELTAEAIEEELEMAAQFHTPNEPEAPRPATERRKSRR